MTFDPRRSTSGLLRRGFTLLELIVVITIIGILGTLVVVKVSGYTKTAKVTKIKADLQAIRKAADLYNAQTGGFPASLEELKSGRNDQGEEVDPLLDKAVDPWNNEYYYELDSTGKPRIYTLGRDGTQGGEGENKDFYDPPEEGQ